MNTMLNIFLDTEFTNFIDTDLISIGMVAQTGEEFYAEVPYPDAACSPFVREVVVPLLDREQSSFSNKGNLGRRMLNWLTIVRPPNKGDVCICFDYETDWCLFADAFDCESASLISTDILSDVPSKARRHLPSRVPSWIQHANVNRNVNALMLWDFYKQYQLPEHHALNDAKALRHAYRPR